MVSRRSVIGIAAAACLRAQDPARRSAWVKFRFTVTDGHARSISGLKPGDFRIFEDGIPQKISIFAEGNKPPLLKEDSATQPGAPGIDLTNPATEADQGSYTITYYPDPSNQNQGFRKIDIAIVPPRPWRVRHRPGYRPL